MKPLSALMGMVTGAMVTTLGFGSAASAADLSFRGTFTQDNDVHLFDFRVVTESTVTIQTYSYGGGTQADGTIIDAGGFDPTLSLFDSTGRYIAVNDDDTSATVAQDPTTGQRYDALLERVLAVGDYTLVLTQYNNFAAGANLSEGFSQENNSSFTSDFAQCTTDSLFCDFTGDIRTNEWAFDAFGVEPLMEADEDEEKENPPVVIEEPEDSTSVPEPTATVAIALAGMLAMKKRYRGKWLSPSVNHIEQMASD